MIELLIEAERALSSGMLDRADQLYRQVADADPHNSIALVGLGRVALERGDDLGAYMLARRALAIDPENEAARRLAAHLEEALATRGEPVADPVTDNAGVAAATDQPGAATLPPGAWSPPTQPPPPPPADASRHRSRLDRLLRRGR